MLTYRGFQDSCQAVYKQQVLIWNNHLNVAIVICAHSKFKVQSTVCLHTSVSASWALWIVPTSLRNGGWPAAKRQGKHCYAELNSSIWPLDHCVGVIVVPFPCYVNRWSKLFATQELGRWCLRFLTEKKVKEPILFHCSCCKVCHSEHKYL